MMSSSNSDLISSRSTATYVQNSISIFEHASVPSVEENIKFSNKRKCHVFGFSWGTSLVSLKMINPMNLVSTNLNDGRRKSCHRGSIRELLKVIAQVLVPLMIGTFTVVIALQQHNAAKENRKKDLEIAQQLREQQYNIDEQRRAQEFQLNEARRIQDISIAENKHRDAVFNGYIRDLSDLLLMSNYFPSRSMLDSIVRPMTLTVLRQLDPSRKVLLIKFLYESKMLRNDDQERRVDLTDGDLNGIRLDRNSMHNLSLVGTSLINASFVSMSLDDADFEGCDLTDASFLNVFLSSTNFYRARLVRTNFNQSRISLVDFSLADLTNSNINEQQWIDALVTNMAIMPNGTEAGNDTQIDETEYCNKDQWQIRPKNGLNITQTCDLIASTDDVNIAHYVRLYFYEKLIRNGKALLQFFFETNQTDRSKIQIHFIYTEKPPGEDVDKGLFVFSHSKISFVFLFRSGNHH